MWYVLTNQLMVNPEMDRNPPREKDKPHQGECDLIVVILLPFSPSPNTPRWFLISWERLELCIHCTHLWLHLSPLTLTFCVLWLYFTPRLTFRLSFDSHLPSELLPYMATAEDMLRGCEHTQGRGVGRGTLDSKFMARKDKNTDKRRRTVYWCFPKIPTGKRYCWLNTIIFLYILPSFAVK